MVPQLPLLPFHNSKIYILSTFLCTDSNHFLSQCSVKNGPMRAANAAGGNDGPLHGPNGPLPAPITTCDSLLTATGKSWTKFDLLFFFIH